MLGLKRRFLLAFVKRSKQLPREVLDVLQNALAFSIAGANLGRVRAKERGRGRQDLPIDDREIERQVVPFNTPAPLPRPRRLAEDRQEIPARIADVHPVLLDLAQNKLKAHDGDGLLEALF